MKAPAFLKNEIVRQSLIAVGAIVVAGLILFFIRNDITQRAETVNTLKTRLAERSRAVSSFVSLKEDVETARQYQRILENRLPTELELINFKQEISNLALRDNVEVGFSFGQTNTIESQPNLEHLTFSISSQGTFENSMAFLKRLENHRFFISVENIGFTGNDDLFQGSLSGTIVTKRADNENLQNQ